MEAFDFDSVVVGSGAGGMAAAVALAQAGHKVLVCEQHEVPGGWTHSFMLGGYRFCPGVHYVGELGPGERLRTIYQGLGVSQDLEFLEINPDGYDHLLFGEERFDIPKGQGRYVDRLKARFPHEAKGIDAFFGTAAALNTVAAQMVDGAPSRPPLRAVPWLARSWGALVDRSVRDPLLRAVLAGQSGDHGLPPRRASAVVHAATMHHYFTGAYYPRRGAFTIPRAFVRALKRAGGEIRLRTPVQRVVLDGRRAVGVELAGGEVVRARHVVSNADPETTFTRLIGREHLSGRLRRRLSRVRYSTSSFALYLAVDLDLERMGFDSGNYWFYDHADLDAIYTQGLTSHAAHATPSGMFVSVTSLKDPEKQRGNVHTVEAFAFVGYDAFTRWEHEPSGHRSEEYGRFKEDVMGRMLGFLDRRIPGLAGAVVFWDLGTPLTNAHYINGHRGNVYGTEKSVWQSGPLGFGARTEFGGLYLCGSSTLSHGVLGATASGLNAAAAVLGCRRGALLKQRGPDLRVRTSGEEPLTARAADGMAYPGAESDEGPTDPASEREEDRGEGVRR